MRLIDEDKLIARFKQLKGSDTLANMFVSDVIKVIKEMTTEYDVDKVVEQLEELADESYKAYCIAFNSDDRAEYDAYTNAIEIVKGGGVNVN